ncbi:type II secretion system F family protein [Oceanobacillus luteolus]|nr:type II secretion system F family protein [Oceanobacillus luteolus]MCM3738745.1 type II secretion system F family protein [Oceanobacillus luteolus]
MRMVSSLKFMTKKRDMLPEEIQMRFLKRLEHFISNGYALQDALEAIAWDKDLADISSHFLFRLKEGERLELIFEETKFHSSVSAFLSFIHSNSNLREAIKKCIEVMEQRFNTMKKLKLIIRYPLMLLFFFSLILFFINYHVLPAFQSLFLTSSQALTTITVVKWIMDFLQFSLIFCSILLLALTILWNYYSKKMPIEEQVKVTQRVPLYRHYLRIQTSFQFATHFSSLLKAGLSLKEILYELSNQQRLPIISYYATLLINNLEHGFHISNLLREFPLIEEQLAIIFQKNATTDVLERDLTLYSDMLLEEMERMTIKIITVIQPIFYIILGIFIIFIYLSLMWPMFQLMNTF